MHVSQPAKYFTFDRNLFACKVRSQIVVFVGSGAATGTGGCVCAFELAFQILVLSSTTVGLVLLYRRQALIDCPRGETN